VPPSTAPYTSLVPFVPTCLLPINLPPAVVVEYFSLPMFWCEEITFRPSLFVLVVDCKVCGPPVDEYFYFFPSPFLHWLHCYGYTCSWSSASGPVYRFIKVLRRLHSLWDRHVRINVIFMFFLKSNLVSVLILSGVTSRVFSPYWLCPSFPPPPGTTNPSRPVQPSSSLLSSPSSCSSFF